MAAPGMDLVLSSGELVLRLVLSLVFGALIGWDREAHRKPAGLRTHMMVCLGSASFMLVTIELSRAAVGESHGLRPDPARIVEGVTAGIGFLGGGSIVRSRVATTTAVLAFVILAGLAFLDRRARAQS